jgi:hypothetical protein
MKKALQKMEKAVIKIMKRVDARDSTRLPCLPVAMRAYWITAKVIKKTGQSISH